MSVSFYMDENVEDPISRALRGRGVDILTAQEDEHRNTPDPIVLDRSGELDRVLVTTDTDLLVEASRRQREKIPFADVVFYPQQTLPWGEVIADLELFASAMDFGNNWVFPHGAMLPTVLQACR